jgi:serine protease AprX
VLANHTVYSIRAVNVSIGAGVYESYNSDLLTVAAKRLVQAGIVVVAAAGNNGTQNGQTQYGGITAPGNAPWVLTVGASTHSGTIDRSDDAMARFSSRGPTAIDYSAKPDLVAPGVGIESLSSPGSTMYAARPSALLSGTIDPGYLPYMSLSGTSQATPVVTGTVALMLQANPTLTPNAVKAILQFTAQTYDGYDVLTQGAGFLNARGAVELATYLTSPATLPYPDAASWSMHLIWGNHLLAGVTPDTVSWAGDVIWGDSSLPFTAFPNVVWGTLCDGSDCAFQWDNHTVTTTSDSDSDTVVWGTSDQDGDTVVWGTSCTDPSCQPTVWGHP